MKKSRKHMWGGMWPFDSGDAAGTTANAAAAPANAAAPTNAAAPANAAAPEKPGFFAGWLGKKTSEQEIADKKEQITKLNSEITEIQMKLKPTPIATGSATTGETESATSATTGETGSATGSATGGGKRSRRRRGRTSKRSRRSRRHR